MPVRDCQARRESGTISKEKEASADASVFSVRIKQASDAIFFKHGRENRKQADTSHALHPIAGNGNDSAPSLSLENSGIGKIADDHLDLRNQARTDPQKGADTDGTVQGTNQQGTQKSAQALDKKGSGYVKCVSEKQIRQSGSQPCGEKSVKGAKQPSCQQHKAIAQIEKSAQGRRNGNNHSSHRSEALQGEPGEYIAVVRRAGENFYLGAATNGSAREIEIPLSFLANSCQQSAFEATIYSDGDDAHWETNPTSYKIEKKTLNHNDTLFIKMAAGGGCAVTFERIDN